MPVRVRTPHITIVDVREANEFAQGHVPGAINVPLASLDRIAEISPSKSDPLYVHCLSGMRSSRACRQLKSMGYANAVNIGGINSYHGPLE
ncbi:MAG TPA: rhodanese-like domain-containing protein [Eggerthellaceae bacterium]|nr:rhodanese-like domain-containing protein [Eggerthellaceae bacterium]